MELQEPVMRSLEAMVGYPVAPRFPDVRGHIADELVRSFDCKDWYFDGEMVAVGDEEERFHFLTGPEMALMLDEGPPELEVARERSGAYFKAVGEVLNLDAIGVVSANLNWTYATDSPDETRAWLSERVGLDLDHELFSPFGGRPTSIDWDAVFEGDQVSSHVRARVLTAAEAAEKEFLTLEEEDLQPDLLLVETNRVWQTSESEDDGLLDLQEAIDRCAELLSRNVELSERFVNNLRGAL
jgi:hypothetical protein